MTPMLKISNFLVRSIGVWILMIGFGSFLFASRYSGAQARVFRETLVSRHPEMDVQEVLALVDAFSSSNETILWIMAGTSIVWFSIVGVLAYALEKTPKPKANQAIQATAATPSS